MVINEQKQQVTAILQSSPFQFSLANGARQRHQKIGYSVVSSFRFWLLFSVDVNLFLDIIYRHVTLKVEPRVPILCHIPHALGKSVNDHK